MGKQDWAAGDTFTRSNSNRPFWVASGIYNAGSTRLEFRISPGRVRYPHQAQTMYSGQQSLLLVNNPAANTFYHIFARANGTFSVSGTTTASVPRGPTYDAEPIGTFWTSDLSDPTKFKGPWNAAAFESYEQRGEMHVGGRMRNVYRQRGSKSVSSNNSGSIPYNTDFSTASGIAFLTALPPISLKHRSLLQATVTWAPSGAFPSGKSDLFVTPVFAIQGIYNSSNVQTLQEAPDTAYCLYAPDPDESVTRGKRPQFTTSLIAVDDGVTNVTVENLYLNISGYRLNAYMAAQATDAVPAPAIRIINYTFVVVPDYYAEDTNEAS